MIIIIKNKNMKKNFNPNFVTGFTAAEGCFRIKIIKNNKFKIGWKVRAFFQINLHKKDLALLKRIQSGLGGVGKINLRKTKDIASFEVSSLKDLKVIIAHFDKFPLITQK